MSKCTCRNKSDFKDVNKANYLCSCSKNGNHGSILSVVCLFIPQVRSSDATWSDTRRNLRKDHRWESASLLEREEKEKLFNEHVEALAKKKKEHFRQLLDETSMVRSKIEQQRVSKHVATTGKVTSYCICNLSI